MQGRSEKDKMLAGDLYRASDPALAADHAACQRLLATLNGREIPASDDRFSLLKALFGGIGERSNVKPPFFCDYGFNIHLGDDVFVNCSCVFLDQRAIRIGGGTQIGPLVQIYAADHPREAQQRRDGFELASPVTVGTNVWIGGGAILCPGVEVGDDAIIGAGSVVTRVIPPGVVAAGNPCRVIREL